MYLGHENFSVIAALHHITFYRNGTNSDLVDSLAISFVYCCYHLQVHLYSSVPVLIFMLTIRIMPNLTNLSPLSFAYLKLDGPNISVAACLSRIIYYNSFITTLFDSRLLYVLKKLKFLYPDKYFFLAGMVLLSDAFSVPFVFKLHGSWKVKLAVN